MEGLDLGPTSNPSLAWKRDVFKINDDDDDDGPKLSFPPNLYIGHQIILTTHSMFKMRNQNSASSQNLKFKNCSL